MRYIGSLQSTGIILDGQRYNLQFETEFINFIFQMILPEFKLYCQVKEKGLTFYPI